MVDLHMFGGSFMTNKPKSKKRQEPENIIYEIKVEDWQCEYMFGLNIWLKDLYPEEFIEYSRLILYGQLLKPVIESVAQVKVVLSARADLNENQRSTLPKKEISKVGSMEISRGSTVLEIACVVPASSFAFLPTTAAAGKINQISLTGTKLKWRKGDVLDLSISQIQ